jgi:hypothetical protein
MKPSPFSLNFKLFSYYREELRGRGVVESGTRQALARGSGGTGRSDRSVSLFFPCCGSRKFFPRLDFSESGLLNIKKLEITNSNLGFQKVPYRPFFVDLNEGRSSSVVLFFSWINLTFPIQDLFRIRNSAFSIRIIFNQVCESM